MKSCNIMAECIRGMASVSVCMPVHRILAPFKAVLSLLVAVITPLGSAARYAAYVAVAGSLSPPGERC